MEIKETEEKKRIWYDKSMKLFTVVEIPLEKLIYNKYNGRIKSIVKSCESSLGRLLDPKNEYDKTLIESFLYDSAEYRNPKTIQSLRDYGQQEVGIVTKDMIIIDGNRRASLLHKISKEDKKKIYFKAIVLDDNLDDKDKHLEIIKLETNYQMGVDSKVDYKPIEKYLRCQELILENNVPVSEVSKLMSETIPRINQWMEILTLMEEYLTYLNSPNVYTRLDKKEGHFVDLYVYLKNYRSKDTLGLDELKKVYFDYVRLGLPVQRIRIIGNPSNSMSLFAKKDYWVTFYDRHKEITQSYKEINFKDLKKEYVEKSNEEVFNRLDNDYIANLGEELKSNLVSGEIFIKSILEKKSMFKELNRIQKYLTEVNINDNLLEEKYEIINILQKIIGSAISLKEKL
jgi:hypothetical protein